MRNQSSNTINTKMSTVVKNSIGRGLYPHSWSSQPSKQHCRDDDDRSFRERDPSSECQQHDRHKASDQRLTPQQKNWPQQQKSVETKICYMCGKKHTGPCKFSMHPDANTNPNVKWLDTFTEKVIWTVFVIDDLELILQNILRFLYQFLWTFLTIHLLGDYRNYK